MITYFRDNLYEAERANMQYKIKVEVDILPFLVSTNIELQNSALQYYRDTLHLGVSLPLFKHPTIYLYLAYIMRDLIQPISNKQVVL